MSIVNLDFTGSNPSNIVTGDIIAITPAILNAYGVVFPTGAPFYANTIKVTYIDKDGVSHILDSGKDFEPIYKLECVEVQGGVYGAIKLFDSTLEGSISLAYNRLGGSWTFNKDSILSYLNSNEYDESLLIAVLTPSSPLILNGVEWSIEGVKGITHAQNSFDSVDLSIKYKKRNPLQEVGDITPTLSYGLITPGQVLVGGSGVTPQKGYSLKNMGTVPLLFTESKKTTNLDIGLVHEELLPGAIYTSPFGYKPVGVILIGNPNAGVSVKYSLRIW